MDILDWMQPLEFVTGWIGADEQNRFYEEARQGGIKRYDESEALALGLRGRVLPSVEKLGREQMGMLEGSGVQQKKDVRRRAATRLAGVQSNLQRRGLGNTTIGASMAKGFGEFEEDQLARIDEQVRQERMQTHGYWGLLSNQLDVDLTGQQIGIKAGYAIPPEQSVWLARSELFARQRPAPEAPEAPGTDYLSLGVGTTTSLVSAKIIATVCIDGDATLETVEGQVSIANVQIGDEVLSAGGSFQKVVNKDYGRPYASRDNDFIQIECGARSLITTVDHVIDGKPAGKWRVGEMLHDGDTVTETKQVPATHCGDILLEDGSDYIANGFRVSTVPDLVSASRPELCHASH